MNDDEDNADDWDDGLDDDEEVIPCPDCGAELHADAEACYACGYWVTDADREAAWRAGSPSQTIRTIGWWVIGISTIGFLAMWLA